MSSAKRSRKRQKAALTAESLDRLLDWLDGDRDRAARRYEEIRSRLIRIFACRGTDIPEELADETIDRVAAKADEIASGYVGNPIHYFCGVADKVYLEHVRRQYRREPVSPSPAPAEADELRYECLESCLERLSPENRELIQVYYGESEQPKTEHRQELCNRLGIGMNALYIRAHRIRERLRRCAEECVRERQKIEQARPQSENKVGNG